MNNLWAPWRMGYISKTRKPRAGCIFCASCRPRIRAARYPVVFQSTHSFCIINIFPYNNGHLMVVPNRHIADITLLTDAELLDIQKSIQRTVILLREALHPEGFNIGVNLGKSAGAGIDDHAHVHIVPRWLGDTNFMPVTGGTKIISQSLRDLYRALMLAQKKTTRRGAL